MIDLGGWMVEMMVALMIVRLVDKMAVHLVAGWDK
jgi:hypothetical protein